MRKVRIMVVCPNQHDATSFYRAMGPLISLAKKDERIELINALDSSWSSLKYVDLVFLQRPHLTECVELLDRAKTLGKRVWVDHDDLLLALPPSNPTYRLYSQDKVRANIATCIKHADVLTVSTPALQKALSGINPAGVVIPNAWDDDLLPFSKANPIACKIIWRGSATHDEDLETELESFKELGAKKYTWELIGDPYWKVSRILGEKATVTPWKGDIVDYHRGLLKARPSVLVAPLAPTQFNYCKSNIAWLEAAWAGAVTVAPAWDEWDRPGVYRYDSNVLFMEAVETALLSTASTLAREYLQDSLRLSKINAARKAIIFG